MIDPSPLARHDRIGLSLSGGKDSMAVLYLLREHLHRITVYHLDTGDLLPEVRDTVAELRKMCPNFVHIQRDVLDWIDRHGMPTDLLPYAAHEVGRMAGQDAVRTVARYECCFANLMFPVWERAKADGVTLLIRGTKTCDQKRLPVTSGEVHDGIEIWLPIADWAHDDVFTYLRSVDAPLPRLYGDMTNAPECARCSAWWGEGRAAYLRKHYPDLFADYAVRLRAVTGEIIRSVECLNRELGVVNG